MNRRGFTLIELLAVIVIITIIALIATPLILNIINNAKRGSFLNSAYGIVKAAEYTYSEYAMNNKPTELIFEYEDYEESSNIGNLTLNYSGSKPKEGTLVIRKDGKIYLAITDGVYCARKELNDSKITVTDISKENDCEVELELPSIDLLGNNPLYVEINEDYIEPGYLAYNIDGSPSQNVEITGEVNTSVLGEYEVTYIVEDDGKIVTVIRNVIVRDTIPPILIIPGDVSITISDVSNFDLMQGVSASDNSGEIPTITISGNLSIIPGIYEITYTSIDTSGNETSLIRYITVQDVNAPVITLQGSNPYDMNVGSVYSEPGYTAVDDVDGNITSNVLVTNNINPNVPGSYQVTYTVTDSSGNVGSVLRTVNVIDNIAPVITFGTNGNSTWNKSHSTTVIVTDLHSSVNSSSLKYLWSTSSSGIVEGNFSTGFTSGSTITNNTASGEYYLWILAKDSAGNTKIERSNVFRLDNTIPVVSGITSNATNVTKNSFTITRSGNASDSHSGLASNPYIYQISLNGSSRETKCTNNTTECNVTGLNDDTTYYYRICVNDNASNQSCISSKTVKTLIEIYGTITDSRDGRTYGTVRIGNQVWFSENLKYTGNGCLGNTWSVNANACRTHTTAWGEEVLYQWNAAMNGSTTEGAQGLCPAGWHIPTDSEFTELTNYIGTYPGYYLKSSSYWFMDGNGSNSYGFNWRPAGYRDSYGNITGGEYYSYLWTSTINPSYSNIAWVRYASDAHSEVIRSNYSMLSGYSVRCIKN